MSSKIYETFSLEFTNSENQSSEYFLEKSAPAAIRRLSAEAQQSTIPMEIGVTFELVPRDLRKVANYLSSALTDLGSRENQIKELEDKLAESEEASESLRKRLEELEIEDEIEEVNEETQEEPKDGD